RGRLCQGHRAPTEGPPDPAGRLPALRRPETVGQGPGRTRKSGPVSARGYDPVAGLFRVSHQSVAVGGSGRRTETGTGPTAQGCQAGERGRRTLYPADAVAKGRGRLCLVAGRGAEPGRRLEPESRLSLPAAAVGQGPGRPHGSREQEAGQRALLA